MKYLSMLASCVLLCGTLASCVHDDVDVAEPDDDSLYELESDEYGLGVTISLDRLSSSTRTLADIGSQGLKDIEEYVNTDNLYILFFNLDGIFLFNIDRPVAIPIGQSALGNDNHWFIRIPVKEINENLIHYIEEHPFKIAVLANWTFDADVNTGGTWDAFEFHEPLDNDGNLTVDEETGKLVGDHISLLSHAQLDNAYKDLDDHGYDHLVYYTETGPHMGPYTEWVSNYHKSIAEAEEDIRNNFDVENNKYTNPESKYEIGALNHFHMEYNNLWHMWYFNGTYKGKGEQPFEVEADTKAGTKQKEAWIKLNQTAKENMMAGEKYGSDFISKSHTYKMKNYGDLYLSSHVELNYYSTGAEVAPPKPPVPDGSDPVDPSDPSDTTDPDPAVEKMKFSAVVLSNENISLADNANGEPLTLSENTSEPHPYIRFTAHADGFVRVNFKARNGARLFAHVGRNNTPQNDASSYQKDNRDSRFEIDPETGTFKLDDDDDDEEIADIPFEPKPIYLYMVYDPDAPNFDDDIDGGGGEGDDGDDGDEGDEVEVQKLPYIEIYSIEYIESRHLYDVDRRGILPTKEYPIPMYGIQDFDPIGEYWEPGLLFNLSQFNNAKRQGYNYRSVSLLRSLSRVEVKLDKKAFTKKPSHVFLRSMNRSARITPVDFFTPTDIIWNGFNDASDSDIARWKNYEKALNKREQDIIEATPGVKGELENIMQYGPIYIGSGKNSGQGKEDMMDEYRKTTAWPFGIWERQWGWDWNRGTETVRNFETYKVGQNRAYTNQRVPEHPRILHTRISRSDYARFTEVSDPEYWHYIMYVPEKNITDADNPGNIADRPKIIHVEIRFNGGFPEYEYDDEGNLMYEYDDEGKPKYPKQKDPDNVVDNFDDNGAYRLYFTEGGRAANLGDFEFNGRESWDKYEYDWEIAKQHWPIIRNHEYIFTVTGSPIYRQNVDFRVEAPEKRQASWEFN